MGINPGAWGPYVWKTIHFVAFNAPPRLNASDQKRYADFYKSLLVNLPCPSCSESAQKFYKQLDIYKYNKTRYGLVYWTYLLHNKVNDKLAKKKQQSLTAFIREYEKQRILKDSKGRAYIEPVSKKRLAIIMEEISHYA